MRAYFDTSAFATLLFEDKRWQTLADWSAKHQVHGWYSDFGWGEFVSSVGIRVRLRQTPLTEATDFLRIVGPSLRVWSHIQISPADVTAATGYLADFALGLKLPDAIHIAIAKRLDLPLVSTDIRQVSAATTLGIAAINPLHTDGN